MSDPLSETKACDLLARLFRARGYTIARNVLFREYGVEFHIDGWDEKARVGFEFLSSEDEDHIDLSLDEYQVLADVQRRGELAIFVIDEVEPLSAAELAADANEFLDEAAAGLRLRRSRGGRAAGRKPRPAAKAGRRSARATAKKAVASVKKPTKVRSASGSSGKTAVKGRGKSVRKTARKQAAPKTVAGKTGLRRGGK